MRHRIAASAIMITLCLAPLACSSAEQGGPVASTSARPPARTVTVTPVVDYAWGQASHAIDGVSVRVHRPVLRSGDSGELSRVGMRAMTCDVEVTNGGPHEVFIGIAGQIGNRAIVPLAEPAVVPPKGMRTVPRVLYVPDAVPATIRLHVAASANGKPIRDGWRFVGLVGK